MRSTFPSLMSPVIDSQSSPSLGYTQCCQNRYRARKAGSTPKAEHTYQSQQTVALDGQIWQNTRALCFPWFSQRVEPPYLTNPFVLCHIFTTLLCMYLIHLDFPGILFLRRSRVMLLSVLLSRCLLFLVCITTFTSTYYHWRTPLSHDLDPHLACPNCVYCLRPTQLFWVGRKFARG